MREHLGRCADWNALRAEALSLEKSGEQHADDIIRVVSSRNAQDSQIPLRCVFGCGKLRRILRSLRCGVIQFLNDFPRTLVNESLGLSIKFISMTILLGQTQRRYDN